jgi:hypothetical protein
MSNFKNSLLRKGNLFFLIVKILAAIFFFQNTQSKLGATKHQYLVREISRKRNLKISVFLNSK